MSTLVTEERIDLDVATFLNSEYTLPPLPEIALRIRQLIEQDDASASEIAELAASDPALVAQTLKMVNSAYYGLPREVTDVKFAIAFLGLGEIYRIILALAVVGALEVKNAGELRAFWEHGYCSALIAKKLALGYMRQLSPDSLWSAALLHDIGQLVYYRFFPAHLARIRQHAREHRCLPEVAEQALGLPPSARLGELLAQHWQLPELIVTSCAHHDLAALERLPQGNDRSDMLRLVALGHLLSAVTLQELDDDQRAAIFTTLRQQLNLDDEGEFLRLMGDVYDTRGEVSAFVSQLV